MTKRAKPKRPAEIAYVVRIRSWEWDYSIGINRMDRLESPVQDYRHLKISGDLLGPRLPKVSTVKLTLLPTWKIDELRPRLDPPASIGTIAVQKGVLDVLQAIPPDALSPILVMLTSGNFRFAVVRGTPLRYRQAEVTDLRLQMDLSEDQLPEGTSRSMLD